MCAATSRSPAALEQRRGERHRVAAGRVPEHDRPAGAAAAPARAVLGDGGELPAQRRLVGDGEIAPVGGGCCPRAARRLPAGVAVADDHVADGAVDREADGAAGAGALRWSRGSAGEQPVEIAVRGPPAAGDADQAAVRDLAHVHVRRRGAPRRARRPRRRARKATSVERSCSAGADDLDPVGEKLPAALGDRGGVVEGPGRPAVERRQQAGKRRRAATSRSRSGQRRASAGTARRARTRPARSSSVPRPRGPPGLRRRGRRSRPARRAISGPRS